MKFTNIKLASGISGARAGQGINLSDDYYVTDSHFAFGFTNSAGINEDYYVVWNNWPEFTTGSNTTRAEQDVSSNAAFASIGIDSIYTRNKTSHVADTSLDIAIIRKSDRRAIHVKITGTNAAHYKTGWVAHGNPTIIDPSDGPWTPEIGRLVNMGYIG